LWKRASAVSPRCRVSACRTEAVLGFSRGALPHRRESPEEGVAEGKHLGSNRLCDCAFLGQTHRCVDVSSVSLATVSAVASDHGVDDAPDVQPTSIFHATTAGELPAVSHAGQRRTDYRGNKMAKTWVAWTVLAALASFAASAQQPGRIYRVGQLGPGPASCTFPPSEEAKGTPWEKLPLAPAEIAIRLGLRDAGWVVGENIIVERRCFPSAHQITAIAAELATQKLDGIFVWTVPATQAAKIALPSIPIVFIGVTDPVAAGFAQSMGRPGGMLTGLSSMMDEAFGKRVEHIRDLLPESTSLALLLDTTDPNGATYASKVAYSAEQLGFSLKRYEVSRSDQVAPILSAMRESRPDALLIGPSGMFWTIRHEIAAMATSAGVVVSVGHSDLADAGALMSYGANFFVMSRRSANFMDRILKGANPADLPIEQPTKFDLVVNLKTAKALGITIPPSLLARADRVIE
jgi:putative tryptophan/tyrosine transport system substrate-binding protein